MFRRVIKWSGYSLAVSFTGIYGLCEYSDVKALGIVRFGRAAITIANISIDYQVSLRKFLPGSDEYKRLIKEVHLRSANRLLDLCYRNGAAFIKVGQYLGNLNYLLPDEYVETLKILHDHAPETPFEELKQVLYQDLGSKVDEHFVEFDREPIGTASLAQVHKAKLKDESFVAVKIQHPNVYRYSKMDMATMELLVSVVSLLFPNFEFKWLAEETRKNLPKELDFIMEGKNAEEIARRLCHVKYLKIPTIHWNLTTHRVLTMEFCKGEKIEAEYLDSCGMSRNEVSCRISRIYSEMIFMEGMIHCDPHPGNLLIRSGTDSGSKPDPKNPQLVLLDHGLYQQLSDSFRITYCYLWLSLINNDMPGIKKWATQLSSAPLFPYLACIVSGRSWESLSTGLYRRQFSDAEKNHIRSEAVSYLDKITHVLNLVPREMLLILKTNDHLRGMDHTLGTRYQTVTLVTMSKYCLKAVTRDQLTNCGIFKRCVLYFWLYWQLFKLTIFENYLHLSDRFQQ